MIPAGTTIPLPYTREAATQALGPEAPQILLTAYEWMVLGRTLDARMQALQRQGRVGFYGAATGQEAVNVGVALASLNDDWIFPGLREQLIALIRGHDLTRYVHHLFADALDPGLGRQMPCHPTAREAHFVSMSSVIGTQISQAVGLAYAVKSKRAPGVALAFFGDGATSSNDFHAGLNLAGVLEVPVLFCLTNNQWAISVPVEQQTHVKQLVEKARAYGLPGQRLDGTDVVAVLRETRSALTEIRHSQKPRLIEFVLFRMTPHTSSDDPKRYQPSDWADRALASDPVARLAQWLEAQGLLDDERKEQLLDRCDQKVRAAIAAAEATPPPDASTLDRGTFANPPLSPAL